MSCISKNNNINKMKEDAVLTSLRLPSLALGTSNTEARKPLSSRYFSLLLTSCIHIYMKACPHRLLCVCAFAYKNEEERGRLRERERGKKTLLINIKKKRKRKSRRTTQRTVVSSSARSSSDVSSALRRGEREKKIGSVRRRACVRARKRQRREGILSSSLRQ